MAEDSTSLKIPTKPPIGGLRKGIIANKANYDQQMKDVDPKTVPNRLGLIIDDSGSMGIEGMNNAHLAVKGFTNNCNPLDTSIAIYPLNKDAQRLVCDYDLVNLYVSGLQATGGTPIYGKLTDLITKEDITRAVLFSDGSPTDSSILSSDNNEVNSWGSKPKEVAIGTIKKYTDKEIPIDTIFIGIEESSGYKEMKKIADLTNGTFIHFKDTNSLSTGLKYLAPKYRALLANPDIKARIERGENV